MQPGWPAKRLESGEQDGLHQSDMGEVVRRGKICF